MKNGTFFISKYFIYITLVKTLAKINAIDLRNILCKTNKIHLFKFWSLKVDQITLIPVSYINSC